MGQITVRVGEELEEALRKACGGNLAGYVRGVLEREVGEGDRWERLVKRVDSLEDFQSMIEERITKRKQPAVENFTETVHVELDGG
jgi:hypothetical protein